MDISDSSAPAHSIHPVLPSTVPSMTADKPAVIQSDFEPLRKKDGTLSKIRSHRGNIPVLPQTKLCPHCPAKFTRTTHLNRHLRNHTNERLHRCETCNSQFTRSDLLTRHKKSCNNPSSRSRRRSCLSCTESKIKCDRQMPCSKCVMRGVECKYGPTTRKTLATPISAQPSQPSSDPDYLQQQTPQSTTHTSLPSHQPVAHCTRRPSQPNSPSNASYTSSSSISLKTPEPLFPAATSSVTYVQDSNGYQQLQLQDTAAQRDYAATNGTVNGNDPFYPGGYAPEPVAEVYSPSESDSTTTDDQLVVSSHLAPAYESDVFAPFFNTIFPQASNPSNLNDVTLSIEEMSMRGSSPEDFPFPRFSSNIAPDRELVTNPMFAVDNAAAKTDLQYSAYEVRNGSLQLKSTDDAKSGEATPRELQHYLHMFFTAFLTQIPIVHEPTFKAEKKSPILLSAMQACGALFVQTKRANAFISRTLASARETLVHDFGRNTTDLLEQVQLILAVVLLQTIGLFHQQSDQRASSSIYHGMLVMMIRQASLIPLNASWEPPNIAEVGLENAWFDWARHEMAKRAILWSYMHDCCHCIYFALPYSYHPTEVKLNLPCEDALWQANNATDWLMIVQSNSRYGSIHNRLTGTSIPKMMAFLEEARTIQTLVPLSPFAHFIIVHVILKRLFLYCSKGKPPGQNTDIGLDEVEPELFRLQYALHNWLQNWKNSSDYRTELSSGEPPFIQNLLPFYWLGQVVILAYQEGLPPFEYGSPNNSKVEVRFRLVKRWLRHIRNFLQSNNEETTLFWDELMKLRLSSWQLEDENSDEQDGLLEFFSEV